MSRTKDDCARRTAAAGRNNAAPFEFGVRQDGVALVVVLWFIAAMSLLVTGILAQSRTDVRMAQMHLAKARATAAADGAIMLAAAEMLASGGRINSGSQPLQSLYAVGDLNVQVTVVRTDGLVNLNTASPDILARLFTVLGAVEPARAQQIADNLVGQRQGHAPTLDGRPPRRFESIEDMLLVEGVDRPLFDSVRDAITAGPESQRNINWQQAPISVLTMLANGDLKLVANVLLHRASGQPSGPPPAGLTGAEAPSRPTNEFRIDAIVEDNAQRLLRRRWLSTTIRSGSALPWEFKRTEAIRVWVEDSLVHVDD